MKAKALKKFFDENKMGTKGTLCLGLVVSREALEKGLPLKFDSLLTENKGQISLLGKAPVQRILGDHGITRVLAEEGGRTNRGNIGLAKRYVDFLNGQNYSTAQLQEVEAWWVERVKEFFAAKPLVLKFDATKSMRAVVRELLAAAEVRQPQNIGSTIVGTVLQHLVGAKLSLLLPNAPVSHGAAVSDAVSERDGDFVFEDIVIHVTTSPGEAVVRKCKRNLEDGKRPIIITLYKKVTVAEGLADNLGISNRVDVFDIEQFLASNLYELGKFAPGGRKETATSLITAYNSIVDACETDPSLKIAMGEK